VSKKVLTGKVVSNKMSKTVVVAINVLKRHPIYNKAVMKTRKFKARDELGTVVGDTVKIEECKPFSKEVTWKVLEVVVSSSAGGKK